MRRSFRAVAAVWPVLLAAWALAAAPTPVAAATVTWGTPTAISGDTDVRTSGLLIGALNLHGPTTTVNGVTFEAMFGIASGDFALSSPGTILGASDDYGSALLPYAGLSDAYKDLLDSGKFTHTPPNSPPPITLTIGGLTIGQLYEFQWWVHDARDTGDLDRTTTATAGDSVALQHNVGIEGDVGQFVLGTFSADATTQAIEFQGFGIGTFVGSTQLNAFQLRTVPEPGCPAAPAASCVSMAKASLSVQEKKAGKEKLAAKLQGLESAAVQADFGDPATGATRYDVCVYDAAGALAAALAVDRAGASCGASAKPCWKDKGGKGWSYKDPDASAGGVRTLAVAGGPAGKGKLQVQAGNNAAKGQNALPTGVAASLQGASSATLQVLTSDARCFEAGLAAVQKADGVQFKAKAP